MAGNTREVDIYESGRAEDKIAALSGIAAALRPTDLPNTKLQRAEATN